MSDMQPITDNEQLGANPSGAYISERFRKLDAAPEGGTDSGNYLVAGICAIIALISFAIMLFLIIQDYNVLLHA